MKHTDLKPNELKAFQFIRNELIHREHSPSVRDVQKILGYDSPRTAMLAINSLIEKGFLKRRADMRLQVVSDLPQAESYARTIEIPLVGTVACGVPILAEENIEAMIPVSERIARPGSKYFLLRASGDSMDKAGINDGDLILVRQQSHADEGQNVVALINDEATVKKFTKKGDTVVLQPCSSNKKNQPIILTDNFEVQGVVITAIPKFSNRN